MDIIPTATPSVVVNGYEIPLTTEGDNDTDPAITDLAGDLYGAAYDHGWFHALGRTEGSLPTVPDHAPTDDNMGREQYTEVIEWGYLAGLHDALRIIREAGMTEEAAARFGEVLRVLTPDHEAELARELLAGVDPAEAFDRAITAALTTEADW